jgi:hypothetical protein
MKKLKLNLDSLRVDSFETTRDHASPRGTVQGHDATQLADTCDCPPPSDGCTFYCGDRNTNTIPDEDERWSNNCATLIEY